MALVDVDLNQSDDQVAAPSTVAPGNDGWKERALLWATIAGAVLGILLGWFLSLDPPKPGSMTLVLLALPGELFLNMLKAMALPLILASIVSGITSLGKMFQ
jgi:solute carrier family 1 (high affinity glutamate transporter) protein 2